ncbi:ubiquitin carboxyl-terminal hydrolase 8 [Rhodamnia argentea]|uniref:Ubiquitin carboxyl-terminal hydrolase n=1 Tax=Rhodamnia argentea TaxID=178133 RepID=A0A8B8NJN9_9MYRT|nr:ubiquitin carboxyl-terminal hydrolase 8 [Rhodamnia argentea]
MDGPAEDSSDATQLAESDREQRVYFVPYRWWKDAHDSMLGESSGKRGIAYAASPASSYGGPMKIINNIFGSDLAFNLRREENSAQDRENGEVGVSGRDFALVSGEMWVQALKWHSDSKVAVKESRSFSAAEDDMFDVYPLQLRLSVLREANSLAVRISKKDNAVELFKRACKIFSVDIELMRIWDFSGQTTLFFLNDNNRFSKDGSRMSDQEVLLELQIYGLSDSIKCREGKKDEKGLPYCNGTNSITINGSTCNGNSDSFRVYTSSAYQSSEAGSLGLTGLQNLGNTCFMNSSLQCLAHTPKLVDYFLGDYAREINHENPLGMDGEIALAFGDLIRKLWAPGASPVAPRTFKSKLARFAPQFSGYNQHDSQELLAFLLDGLHEDLNRVKCKPYVEAKDADGRPDEDVADEYWHYHLARNDSVIVDVCQGQYKSTLVCPVCKKVSVTFDPFMYVSLPLPSTTMRTMTLTVITTDGSTKLSPYTITVPKFGKCEDLFRALSSACSLGEDETLLLAEIYNNRIIRYLEEPTDSLTLIRDEDRLVAYRLAKDSEDLPLVVFMHQRMEQSIQGNFSGCWKSFGIPLVARLSGPADGSNFCSLYLRLLNPFRNLSQDVANENDCSESSGPEDATTAEDASSSIIGPGMSNNSDVERVGSTSDSELKLYLTDGKGITKDCEIQMSEPVVQAEMSRQLNVLVCWPENQIKKYDASPLSSLPEIFKTGFFSKKALETASLYKCLEAFLTEEPLGPDDMWYCPRCKEHRQASKKLDLWRLPEILVVHLKRFSYSRFMKNKLETYVDFPIDNLDLSAYIACKNGQSSCRYMLYAVSNHYGSMGGGHYTAFVHHGGNRWYDFDDSHVYPISMEKIKTSAAYVLFYRRVIEV